MLFLVALIRAVSSPFSHTSQPGKSALKSRRKSFAALSAHPRAAGMVAAAVCLACVAGHLSMLPYPGAILAREPFTPRGATSTQAEELTDALDLPCCTLDRATTVDSWSVAMQPPSFESLTADANAAPVKVELADVSFVPRSLPMCCSGPPPRSYRTTRRADPADDSFGTAIKWSASLRDACEEAERTNKLVLVLHVSGNFKLPEFT